MNGTNASLESPRGLLRSSSFASSFRRVSMNVLNKRRTVQPFDEELDVEEDLQFINAPRQMALQKIAASSIHSLYRSSTRVISKQTSPAAPTEQPTTPQDTTSRFRSSEELCVSLLNPTSTKAVNAWYLVEGYIGRYASDGARIATSESKMDAIHAKITLEGDEYLIQDHSRSRTTFLCLSTIDRHHSQRDGYRLRVDDRIFLGSDTVLNIDNITMIECNYERQRHQEQGRQGTLNKFHHDNESGYLDRKTDKPRKKVRFSSEPPMANDGMLLLSGSIYKRSKKRRNPYNARKPLSLEISFSDAKGNKKQEPVILACKKSIVIGSSQLCDVVIPADDVCPVHARIIFDGMYYLLEDLTFEERPRHRTRVELIKPTRIGRGDVLLLGQCIFQVMTPRRAFPEKDADMLRLAIRCQVLRESKRKARTRQGYAPIGYCHRYNDNFVVGRGKVCDGPIASYLLNSEQFGLNLDGGASSITPLFAGLNQGVYLLLGRNALLHATKRLPEDPIGRTSKALMLRTGTVFRCGCSEVEVVHIKSETANALVATAEDTQQNALMLVKMPWMQQIARNKSMIETLAQHATQLHLQPGDVVHEEGDPASFLFVVMKGQVNLTIPDYRSQYVETSVAGGVVKTVKGSESSTMTSNFHPLNETVGEGGYFGEICLQEECDHDIEYTDKATAETECTLLVLSKADLRNFLLPYLDILRCQLPLSESRRDLMQKLRLHVPCLEQIAYDRIQQLSLDAVELSYDSGDTIFNTTVGFKFQNGYQKQGLMILTSGEAAISFRSVSDEQSSMEANSLCKTIWTTSTPLIKLASNDDNLTNIGHVSAKSTVNCFFIGAEQLEPILATATTKLTSGTRPTGKPAPPILSEIHNNKRKSSYKLLAERTKHSYVVRPNRRSIKDNTVSVDSADLKDLTENPRKWRRKKRNRALLDQTIVDVQSNMSLRHAVVLYVLSGANRGDIHVVNNAASIGSLGSSADIELNDKYVSKQQAVIQHRFGSYWLYDTCSDWGTYTRLDENQKVDLTAGDVFLAGEVEFTCLGTFPERQQKKRCCIQ